MNQFPFIPLDQLQRMISNALLQKMKQGPGAAPFDPLSFQLYDQSFKNHEPFKTDFNDYDFM
jgi:hypothetical protein